ncbi:cob(I)yrinic acid a,c-diamide adenosyltransferase [Arthrobacter sulfonylureivorans]|uniref:Corrinoid adenosyltransferase n=1 Tax=Arthrobacter sulfonylureivorans TaxID=2486855 RepID=A0ABY3WCZ3_9MICC|nr:cob(I)yrinic acid a,c-diamide adenosyltransferase [Arthrobacter sulfonylureivorans]UNK46261.1 cob(I)yrinic acid a,c-diamide adenosyltransferase [Arthrobacter sulfonylureivorans]
MNERGEFAADNQAEPDHYGDSGRTLFGSHGEVSKNDLRVIGHAEVDAANAAVAVAMAGGGLPPEVNAMLVSVQNDLFDLMADLQVPYPSDLPVDARIIPEHAERLERAMEHFRQEAGDLSGMLLPGGTLSAALLYQARTAVRRAERTVWAALDEHGDVVNRETAVYLNRLSGLLFVMGRAANAEHGDVMWVPESSVRGVLEDQAGTD